MKLGNYPLSDWADSLINKYGNIFYRHIIGDYNANIGLIFIREDLNANYFTLKGDHYFGYLYNQKLGPLGKIIDFINKISFTADDYDQAKQIADYHIERINNIITIL